MPRLPKRKPNPYEEERVRLLDHLNTSDPESPEYETVMKRLDQLDRILNRTSEMNKTLIPALSTVASVAGIYGLQQFAGVLIPKALDTIASRASQKSITIEND